MKMAILFKDLQIHHQAGDARQTEPNASRSRRGPLERVAPIATANGGRRLAGS